MRARCRCPHITHYSLSRLINEIKNASHTAFESCFRGWLVGGNACTDRHQTLFPWPKGQTMVKGCQSCESASLPLLSSSSGALVPVKEKEREWGRGERERERDARQRLLQYDISHRDLPQQPLAFKLLFKQADRVPNSMAVVSGGWCACRNIYHRQLRSRHIRLTVKMQPKQSWQVHTVWTLHTTLALRHLVNTQSFCTGS